MLVHAAGGKLKPTAARILFGLAKNERLIAEIKTELDVVAAKSRLTGRMERRFKSFMWMTRRTWSRRRRIVSKAEWTQGEANPRFVVTSLGSDECKAKYLYEKVLYEEMSVKHCQAPFSFLAANLKTSISVHSAVAKRSSASPCIR